ncbi:MAG: hypothetical protein J6Z23_05255 [Lachnospiraceae bacterium]|nr:hypothetical protein [Lachnospiraceae bacterium]
MVSDIYFNPVPYVESEGAALHISIAGFVFYVLAMIGTVIAGFGDKLTKE